MAEPAGNCTCASKTNLLSARYADTGQCLEKEIVMSGSLPHLHFTRRLPPHPSLEQLRKQAKDLLAGYRSGEPEAVAEVQRFERRPDAFSFALNDAQHVLARAYGYESWPKLKAFVDGVNVARLAEAVKNGDIAQARILLKARPELVDMDMSGSNEHRALHYAVLRRDRVMVRLLMEAGADARKGIWPHRDATSAFAIASDRGYEEIVAVIEDEERRRSEASTQCAAITAPEHDEVNAAVARGDAARVRELIGADRGILLRKIDWRTGGLLTLAVKRRQIEIVRLLLDLGADVDERTLLHELEEPTLSWGAPLWHAALAGDYEITELLLDRGADPNANVYASGWPLRNAWNHQDDSVKKLLLARGARPQPYMIAEAHDVEEARRLLEADSSEDQAQDQAQELAQELAWSAADHGCPAIVELALPRLTWKRDDPRWHWVLIQPIRGAGEDPARNEGHFASMEALLQHGIDPNVSRFGQTALHFAAARHAGVGDADRARFASMLLDHGARLDLRDDLLHSTPLGWACRWGRTKVAELLIVRGAPVEEPDAEPWATPKAWAEKMKHKEILKLLATSPR
jgi:ankyrin repeat protein